MTVVFPSERIDPDRLSEPEREALSKKLYEVHKRIFGGLDEKAFDRYVVHSLAKATTILLYRNRQKELVGYFGVHRFDKLLEKRQVVVFRSEVGLLPGYRQTHADLSLLFRQAIKFKFLHPRSRVYFLCAPVNPSSYAVVARYTRKVYPRYNRDIPSDILRFMKRLADEFGLRQADETNPLVRQVGWITRATDHEKEYWQSSGDPDVRFYIETNPKYQEGKGLLTLVPLTIMNGVLSLFDFGLRSLSLKLGKQGR